MADNFKDTAYRMYESSGILFKDKQWFNANYLAGYILECYCKLVLTCELSCGGSLTRASVRGYSHNINELRNEVDLILLTGGTASQYCINICTECNELYLNWNPKFRYEDDTYIFNDSLLAKSINDEINRIIYIVLQMEVDGVI